MAAPDVRIRLSAEGVAEVVGALKKIQTESAAAAGKGSGAFKGFNSVLTSTKALLGALGVALSLGALTAFAKKVADFAGNMKEAGERIGTTTERVSALAHAAANAGTSLGQLEAATGFLNKNLAEGGEKFAKALSAIGLSLKDFEGLDTAQRLGLIAQKFSTLQTSGEKTALAMEIFGKSGKQLIPLLNEMGGGIDALVESSTRLGVVVTEETAVALDRMGDSLNTLKTQAIVTAAQFLTGLAPDVNRALESMSDGFSKNKNNAESWGRIVGAAADLIGTSFVELTDQTVTLIRQIAAFSQIVTEGPQAAGKAIADIVALDAAAAARQKALFDELDRRADQRRAEEGGPPFQPVEPVKATVVPDTTALRAADAAAERERKRREDEARKRLEDQKRAEGLALAEQVRQEPEPLSVADQEAIDRLRELNGLTEEQAEALARVAEQQKAVHDAAIGLLQSGLAGFFERGTSSLDEFAAAVRRFASELLAAEVIARASSFFAGAGVASGAGALGDFPVVGELFAASGGYVSGPGTATSDSIAARLSAGEFVTKAAVVSQPGVLSHLAMLNRYGVSRFAEGGLVGGEGAAAGAMKMDSSLTVGLENGLVLRQLDSPEGQRIIIKALSENQKTLQRLASR